MSSEPIKAILFDLDSCLSPADEAGQELYATAFQAITAANKGSHAHSQLQNAFADMWRLPFDFVASRHAFTPEMRSAGWNALANVEVLTPMKGYGDLSVLAELPGMLFLVTSGFARLQESKIRALGISSLFTGIYVDAIDKPGHRGKQPIFEEILRTHSLEPRQVLIVGDNEDSEIKAGARLGIRTVQTLRPGVPHSQLATYHVGSLHELKRLIDHGL